MRIRPAAAAKCPMNGSAVDVVGGAGPRSTMTAPTARRALSAHGGHRARSNDGAAAHVIAWRAGRAASGGRCYAAERATGSQRAGGRAGRLSAEQGEPATVRAARSRPHEGGGGGSPGDACDGQIEDAGVRMKIGLERGGEKMFVADLPT
ncbi:hypothetical protein Syun_004793 [Stephania yunnanensis]|uniref:Uncharacterized protein n=1 Tax=Stephania yunnanensis TaxID=152371 RepID=A0AAP0L448_9MAGN